MRKKQVRTLTKLTSAETLKPMYIDISEIAGLESEYPAPTHFRQYNPNGSISSSATVTVETCTRITLKAGNVLYVKEHYLEILAMAEGRDPAPAQVIYGKK